MKGANIILRYIIILFFTLTQLLAVVAINSATANELLELNGIGKAKAVKIINYRNTIQCFKSIDELARVDGISKKLVDKNRAELSLGICQKGNAKSNFTPSAFIDVLLNPINLVFVVLILILTVMDLKTKKDFKSQIASMGVLGTFVGIFIGLQNFNPEDIINSVNDILSGLKTAFFTSIVGMGMAIILTIIEKLKDKPENR